MLREQLNEMLSILFTVVLVNGERLTGVNNKGTHSCQGIS